MPPQVVPRQLEQPFVEATQPSVAPLADQAPDLVGRVVVVDAQTVALADGRAVTHGTTASLSNPAILVFLWTDSIVTLQVLKGPLVEARPEREDELFRRPALVLVAVVRGEVDCPQAIWMGISPAPFLSPAILWMLIWHLSHYPTTVVYK